jgi:broad specificity phosphatase PhoE
LRIDRIYSSPLLRAVETASFIAREKNQEAGIIECFREVNVGSLEDMEPDETSWGIYSRVLGEWLRGNHDCSFPGGETRRSLSSRFLEGLKSITKDAENETIVVVGHAGIFTNGIADLCNIDDHQKFFEMENHNCSVSVLEFDGERKMTVSDLKVWANTDHLSGEAGRFVESVPAYAKLSRK